MSYAVRILPPDEWPRLKGTPLETVVYQMDPVNVRVAVVEDGESIVGTLAAFRIVHVHGLWMDPARHKAPGIGRRLMLALERIANDWASPNVLTERVPEHVADIIGRMGAVPWDGPSFIIPVTERETCPKQ